MTSSLPPSPGPTDLPDSELLRLDHQVCFSLQAASRAFGGVYREALRELGLTYPQYLAMMVLWEHGPLPVRSIGERLHLDSGTLSPLLKRLETAGLVRRERSAQDERSVVVHVTDAGAGLRERALPVPRTILAATGLPVEEIVALQRTLGRLTASLSRAV
ncbi:MarR family transcriptional regulator [Streptomyces sp. NPDC020403]|uniref:MarR family winged helix-turn-helix transcriptional regulator n=1 Tax=unclassified Streptomyces TaxID=2593676 RepID=UPI0033F68270